eukprot:4778325-Pyramimonas_sp.AAC.1
MYSTTHLEDASGMLGGCHQGSAAGAAGGAERRWSPLEATAAARVAYHLKLEGPCEAVDAGGASGLVALRHAAAALGLPGGMLEGALVAAA